VTRDDALEARGGFKGAVEDYPFGGEVAVYKVGGRMFALVSVDGAHKRHWNTGRAGCAT